MRRLAMRFVAQRGPFRLKVRCLRLLDADDLVKGGAGGNIEA
jgi:hypothetical protein